MFQNQIVNHLRAIESEPRYATDDTRVRYAGKLEVPKGIRISIMLDGSRIYHKCTDFIYLGDESTLSLNT